MVRKILNRCDEKLERLDVYDKLLYLKSCGLGFMDGVIDGMIITWPFMYIALLRILKTQKD